MREAAKALDDGLMLALEVQIGLKPRFRKQQYSLRMDERGLAVHEGHVAKSPLLRHQSDGLPAGHQRLCQRQCLRVLRKRSGLVAKDIARELVQHNDLGQPPLRRGAPMCQFTAHGGLQGGAEALTHQGVQRRVFGKAARVVQLVKPEVQEVCGLHGVWLDQQAIT